VAEASIVARLLRLRLLTLDATVVMSPAAVMAPAGRPRAAAPLLDGPRSPPAPAAPVGRRLALAARAVDESAAALAAARQSARRIGA